MAVRGRGEAGRRRSCVLGATIAALAAVTLFLAVRRDTDPAVIRTTVVGQTSRCAT